MSLIGVLSMCAPVGAVEFGKVLHGFLEKVGFLSLMFVNNTLMGTYSKQMFGSQNFGRNKIII